MAVTAGFRAFALEQLGRVASGVRARSMFGGIGIYSGNRFFALLDDDVLYLKADGQTRSQFEAREMPPFRPFGDQSQPMQYYAVPAELLEDAEALRPWVDLALAAADRAPRRSRRPP